MKHGKNDKKLDELISRVISREEPKFDFDKWKQTHKEAIEIFESQTTDKQISHFAYPLDIWRIIMKSRITKLAAAAVIIIVIIGLHKFNNSINGTSVAWADVAKRLEQMSSYKARSSRVFTEVGQKEPHLQCEVFTYFSPDHGYMEEQYIGGELGMLGYGLFSEKLLIIVLPQTKQYYRFELNEEILSMVEYINPMNPNGIMKLFGSDRCTRLSKRKINGVDAEGFEVRDIKVFSWVPRILFKLESIDMRVWVDPDTLLPIEVETVGLIEKGLLTGFKDLVGKNVMYDIEYDAEIDENIFEPNIPDDYRLIDPANMAERAEITMLGIVPCGAAVIIYKHIKKRRNGIICSR
jgi:hypothetical protein